MTQPVSTSAVIRVALAGIVATLTFFPSGLSAQAPAGPPPSPQRQVLDRYCAACHNEKLKTAGLNLVQADLAKPGAYPELWEKVVRKVRTGVMPPANMAQPSEAERLTLLTFLETSLDAASARSTSSPLSASCTARAASKKPNTISVTSRRFSIRASLTSVPVRTSTPSPL